jgi:hypothetical protein
LIYFFIVLFFQVTLFGINELDNYKYNNSIILFFINFFLLLKKRIFPKEVVSEKYLNKYLDYIYFKVAND